MKIFTYWNNSKKWQGILLSKITAKDILTADEVFKKQHGMKNIPGFISTTIENILDK
jgi:hypothetical protein